jgi:tetratricopeptide (TPR) repeat protein
MPRRKPMTKGPWDDPVSPLQAARFARRQTRQEIVDLVHLVCPGKGGEECKLDADKLGEYERGARRPGIEHVTAFCRVFKKSPEELGLIRWSDEPATNGTNQTSIGYPEDAQSQLLTFRGDVLAVPVGPSGQEVLAGRELEVSAEVERIQFIKAVGTVAGAVVADPIIAAAQHAHNAITLTSVSSADVDRLAEAAHHHARTYYQLTDPGRTDALLLDWATAGRLIGMPATQGQRRDLFDAYARLCGVLGCLSFDQGEIARARVLLETGRAVAGEAGDGDLLGWLLQLSSLVAREVESDPSRALALAELGIEAVGRTKTMTSARLYARRALACAQLGQRAEVLASLDRAESDLLSASPGCWPSDADTPRNFVFAPDVLVTSWAETYLILGDLGEAIAACEQAAALLNESSQVAEGSSAVPQNQLNLAIALARTGELEGACRIAAESLTGYKGVAATYVIRRARRFERSLAPYASSPHSREFSELLRDRERALRAQSLRQH